MTAREKTGRAPKPLRESIRREFERRRKKHRDLSAREGIDGILITHLPDIRYLCGFTGSSGLVLLLENRGYFISDFRYREQSALEVMGLRTVIYDSSMEEAAASVLGGRSGLKLGFDALHISYAQTISLRRSLRGHATLVRLREPLSGLRERKSAAEIAIIRRGVSIAEGAFLEALRGIDENSSEMDFAAEIDIRGRKKGAESPSFPTIVASGKRGALVHADPSRARLRGPMVVDWGVMYEGYCSDCTRTLALGKIPSRLREMHALVLEAQHRAMDAVKPGIRARDIDGAAREIIEEAGYGKDFGHGLGHGVGLEVHERPYVGKTSADIIEEGMVFTIEPGIYVHGLGGVRVEDMVLVTTGGVELLTNLPRGLDPAEYV